MPITDPVERKFRVLLRVSEREMRKRFAKLVEQLRRSNKLDQLERLIDEGRIAEAMRLVDRAARSMAELSATTFVTAGQTISAQISREAGVPVTFEQANLRAADILRGERLRLITRMSEQQRRAVRQALVIGTELGENPRDQARRFRDSIGLTRNGVRAVDSYRRALEAGSVTAANRELSDGRVDRTVRAIAAGNRPPMTQAEIDRAVDGYRKAQIATRAKVIARTEALRAVHLGGEEAWRQAIEDGDVRAEDVVRIWRTARDPRVRDFDTSDTSHVVMEGQERGVGEPFVSGAGALLMYPGDRSAPANDTIQCRCVVVTRLRPAASSSGRGRR